MKRLPLPPPPDFTGVRARIEDHGARMREARIEYGSADICPDCFKPWPHCLHVSRKKA